MTPPTIKVPIEFISRHRARFAEVDPYGHVNTQHFLSYFIDHRFIGMREKLGWDLKVISGFACRFVTSKIELEFISPLYVDEEFEIRSSIVEFQGRTCIVELRMLRGNSATCIARSKMELACVDKKSGVPIDWPQNFIEACYATAK